ncbi:MAG TPA: hypothetical protein VEG44_06300 [Candidatus Acidoferrales bacterium]|nr:hypothetical protein [Candidatus Acidoferrales bacterium]
MRIVTKADANTFVQKLETDTGMNFDASDEVRAIKEKLVESETTDSYIQKIQEYIPAPVVGAYLTIIAIFNGANSPQLYYWIFFGLLWIGAFVYTWKTSSKPNYGPAIQQIIIATISFAVWVAALGKPFSFLSIYDETFAIAILIVWTLVPPLVLPTEQPLGPRLMNRIR